MFRVRVADEKAAQRAQILAERTLADIDLGYLSVPPVVDVRTFILSGGQGVVNRQRIPTLGDAVGRYLSTSMRAPSTLVGYRCHFGHMMRYHGPGRPLLPFDVDGYTRRRLEYVKAYTVRQELITLRVLLQSEGLEPISIPELAVCRPLPFAPLNIAMDGRRILLTADNVDELRRLVRDRGSELISDVVDLVALTGIRRSEVCRLGPQHVDLENRQLIVPERKRVHGVVTYRRLPIHDDLVSILDRRRHSCPVFTESPHTLTGGLRKAIQGSRFDVKGFGYHCLRHSAASRLLAQGVPITVVSALLGHSTAATTLKVYSHAFEDGLVDAVGRL